MPFTPDMAWQATAWGLALLAGALALWAVWGDRLRHLRRGLPARCPRCWYDMSGSRPDPAGAHQCPECAKDIRGERGLHRTRRRWRWFVPVPLVLAAAWCAACVPDVNARGWWAMAPRAVLFWALPDVQRGPPAPLNGRALSAVEELELRVLREHGELVPLYWMERLVLRNRARAVLAREDASAWARVVAARALVRADPDAVNSVPNAGLANVVLAKVEQTYANCQSFRCRGTRFGNIGVRPEEQFIVLMERPRRFRFECLDGHPHQQHLSMRSVVWRDDGPAYRWSSIRGRAAGETDRPGASVGVFAPGFAISMLPELIRTGDRYQWSPFELIGQLELTSGVEFAGRKCFKIRGVKVRASSAETYWIDQETYLLLRHDQSADQPEFESTTVYRPELDVAIDPAWFTFDPAAPDQSLFQDEGVQERPAKK